MKWIRVNKRMLCPICNHADWCGIAENGEAAICMRIMSDRRTRNGGWLHVFSKETLLQRPAGTEWRPSPSGCIRDWDAFAARCRSDLPDQDDLAERLGVRDDSLGALEYGWSIEHGCYTFPMRDSSGTIIGIRTRYRNGEKRCVVGSRTGLFIPTAEPDETCWVCEGPTDCAALLSLGLYAIGRPSNVGGHDLIVGLAKSSDARNWFIMADRDSKHETDAITRRAADELAESLRKIGKRTAIIRPQVGFKDAREWLRRSEISALTLMMMAKNHG